MSEEMIQAPQILDSLKEQARKLLSSALGSRTLSALSIGGKGLFPYYWQSTTNTKFRNETYTWIASQLAAKTTPATLDAAPFTNQYIQAISKVTWGFSAQDQEVVNKAHQRTQTEQGALIKAWTDAGNPLPPGPQPINGIVGKIQTEWGPGPADAPKKLSLREMQQSTNLSDLLENQPPSGGTVILPLANWLAAMAGAVTIVNNKTMSTAYLAASLRNTQHPKAENGGLVTTLNNEDVLVPAWKIAEAQAKINAGLENDGSKVGLDMEVRRQTSSEYSVSIAGGAGFRIGLGFFGIGAGTSASYFRDEIATTDNKVAVNMSFPGVSLVNYEPTAFTLSGEKYWYWVDPIRKALDNPDGAKTGYKFFPKPQIDFGVGGDFGFTTGVAIARYPTVTVKVTSDNYRRIEETFKTHTKTRVSFLGITLASGSVDTYSHKVQTDQSSKTVTITLSPPATAGSVDTNTAWVLGAVLDYPAA